MLVMALNAGSATLKYQVYDTDKAEVTASGYVQKIGSPDSFTDQKHNGEKVTKEIFAANHGEALGIARQMLADVGIDMADVKAVGHRVVQGGEKYKSSVMIDDQVIKNIEELAALAPLHNPANLMGIRAAREMLPSAAQVAVFDTAFHQSMPDFNYRYSVPNSWYKDLGVRKYGFHGTSHLFVSKRAAAMLGKPAQKCNLVTLHIGSGASACAIKNGVSYDTSMGMTPLPGLTMGTRTGDIDPGVILYVMERLGLSAAEMNSILSKKSGHMGVCGLDDRRDIIAGQKDSDLCRLSVDIEINNVKKYIGAYVAELGHVDAIVLTAGIGENNSYLRGRMLEGLEHIGIKLDYERNNNIIGSWGKTGEGGTAGTTRGENVLSTDDSKIKIFMVPTNEELVIIEDTLAILNGTYDADHLRMKYSFNE